MRVAAIDIGTNCVLLLIAEVERGTLRALIERATITRLGQGVDRERRLLPEACARTLTCLTDYAQVLAAENVDRLDVVGTSALRDASGGEEFVASAKRVLGVAPRVIDGVEEARLTFLGALSGLSVSGPVNVFDIGGGSTEIVCGALTSDGPRIERAVSLNIGSVRLFERHVHSDPPTEAELRMVELDIAQALTQAPEPTAGATLVGVAGTVTQLAALNLELAHYDSARVHGSALSSEAVTRLTTRLASLDLAQRRALPGMERARADVMVVGSAIARAVLAWSRVGALMVSDRGVRWGLAAELAAGS